MGYFCGDWGLFSSLVLIERADHIRVVGNWSRPVRDIDVASFLNSLVGWARPLVGSEYNSLVCFSHGLCLWVCGPCIFRLTAELIAEAPRLAQSSGRFF